MKDYLGNQVSIGDTVIIAVRSGRTATLGRAYVKDAALKPQFAGGLNTNMLEIEWSNIHKYWMPASKVVRIPDEMLPERRITKLNDTEEGVQPSVY